MEQVNDLGINRKSNLFSIRVQCKLTGTLKYSGCNKHRSSSGGTDSHTAGQ